MPATLPTRKLGKNGPPVTAIGFGLMGLDAFYGKAPSQEDKFKVLDRAIELGCTNWDSADMYLGSEDTIGAYFKARPGAREKVFLATKFANTFDPVTLSRGVDSSPKYAQKAIEKSLARLGLDYVDLYYVHRVNPDTPIESTVRALAALQSAGKIKHIGLSEVSSATLRRACAIVHIDAVQIEYSPFSLDIESEEVGLLKTCRELGVAVVAYSPLGRGMLTGRYKSLEDFEDDDFRKMSPRFSSENFPKNLELVEKLKVIADKKGCTPGQLSLAWLLAQGEDVIPIPGTKSIKYLEENVAAALIDLSPEEEKEIRAVVEKADSHGERYPAAFMSYCFSDTVEEKR